MAVYEEDFALRLSRLRLNKNVSARDMSLSIGQNAGYINNIENGKALPSMSNFFFICEYLDITPQEFFETDSEQPKKLRALVKDLKRLDRQQFDLIAALVKNMAEHQK